MSGEQAIFFVCGVDAHGRCPPIVRRLADGESPLEVMKHVASELAEHGGIPSVVLTGAPDETTLSERVAAHQRRAEEELRGSRADRADRRERLIWKHEADAGQAASADVDIGPAWIERNGGFDEAVGGGEWMTRASARALAESEGYDFFEDG